jgi:hypothetical protein
LFKGFFSKLLVCGGVIAGSVATDTCEVVSLESSATTCKNLPDFPAAVFAAIGGTGFKENPIICGGIPASNRCYSLENNEWVSSDSMNSVRFYGAADQLQDGKLLVTGGVGLEVLNSAEILTENGWESNIPSLAVTIYDHCLVTINSTTVMVIGGIQNNQISGKTFYFNFGEDGWTEGPELKNKRRLHSCGRIRRDKDSQEMSTIVVSGQDLGFISSVEILDEGSNEWQTAQDLTVGIGYSQLVEDQNGGVVLIGGLSNSNEKLDSLYQLPHGGKDAVWIKMDQKLKLGRHHHTAFLVPDAIVDCF